jgi:cell division initiation protein
MRITPLDVRKQEFRKGMRGLDPEEVYAFLSTVADEYESVLNDNKALRERLLELDDKVHEYRSMEKTLRDTLLTAERVNVEAKENARREANIIIKEAQIEAEKALRDIKTEAMKLRSQVQNLRSQRDAYLARMKVVAESHLGSIETAAADFEREDRALSDLDLNEEQLADKPVERESEPAARPSNLFDGETERPASSPSPSPIPSPSPAPAPPSASPRSEAPAPSPSPSPSPAESSPNPPKADARAGADARIDAARGGGLSSGSVDPISVIIDRMKKGQQEILSSGAGTPGYQELPEAPTSRPAEPATAVEPAPATAPGDDEPDVTNEFSLEEIRRELAAEKDGDR